jgi:hypothetical protein
MLEDDCSVALEKFVEDDARLKAAEDPRQGALAFLDTSATVILSVKLDQIEGTQLGGGPRCSRMRSNTARPLSLITISSLPIMQERTGKALTASRMRGRRSLKSLPLRVSSRHACHHAARESESRHA